MTEFRFPQMKIPTVRMVRDDASVPCRSNRIPSAASDFLDTHLTRTLETRAGSEPGVVQYSLSRARTQEFFEEHVIPYMMPVGACKCRQSPRTVTSLSGGASQHGGDPPWWPFVQRKCTYELNALVPRFSAGTCEKRGMFLNDVIFIHFSAYVVVKAAYNTLLYMSGHPELRAFLWNWGNIFHPYGAQFWDYSEQAKYAGLWYWFGEDDAKGTRLARIKYVFSNLIKWFEKGAVGFTGGNWDTDREPVRYWCSDSTGCGARHPVQRDIELCNEFAAKTLRHQIGNIIHECFHNVGSTSEPRDVVKLDTCFDVWGLTCFAPFTDLGRNPWLFGENPQTHTPKGNNPRRLVTAGHEKYALSNVDNYVSWACRRWDNSQFRICDAPIPPQLAIPPP